MRSAPEFQVAIRPWASNKKMAKSLTFSVNNRYCSSVQSRNAGSVESFIGVVTSEFQEVVPFGKNHHSMRTRLNKFGRGDFQVVPAIDFHPTTQASK